MVEIYYRPKRTNDAYMDCECFDVDTIKEAKEMFNKTTNRNKEYVIVETKVHNRRN